MNNGSDFSFEYEYVPTPDAEERLERVWDIIFELIMEELRAEAELEELENNQCSTQSASNTTSPQKTNS